MPNDSSTGGYLPPAADPLYDDALDDFLHDVVAGVTGLGNTVVRPRWQPEPPDLQAFGTDWVGFGVTSHRSDTHAFTDFSRTVPGSYFEQRHEVFDLFCSFYGPHADRNAARLRDGLQIAQNREALYLAGMGLVSASDLTSAPELIKERWLNRSDLTVTLRREIRRVYPVLYFLSSAGSIVTDISPLTVTFDAEP